MPLVRAAARGDIRGGEFSDAISPMRSVDVYSRSAAKTSRVKNNAIERFFHSVSSLIRTRVRHRRRSVRHRRHVRRLLNCGSCSA